jgi:hypothetical protein
MVYLIVLFVHLETCTSSIVDMLAAFLVTISCLWTEIALGPLRLFSEISM